MLGTLPTRGWRTDRAAGQRCTIALRPTLLAIAAPGEDGAHTGRVVRSVFQGTSMLHVIDIAGAQVTLESLSEERHPDGAEVGVRPIPGAVFALLDD